jgi:hypothetical protein
MNSTLEKATVAHHHSMSRSEQDWRDYLGITPDQLQISQDHRFRLALTRLFQQYEHENRKIFHLTVTYKPYPLEDFTPDKTNRYFINFYLKTFLPLLMRSKNFHIPSKRIQQPICYAFLDEHDQKVSSSGVMLPDRLHHHAILAVHQNTYLSTKSLESMSKIPLKTRWSHKVMTTHLRECEPMTMLYATKNLRKYPEFLSFPDRLV